MIGCAGQWTRTPSTTALQPKNMKCSFLDCVHFWWSTGLIDELEPHLPLLSCQKNEMLIFWLRSTSDDQPGWSMDSKPICHPSPANKMKCFFLDCVHFWWSARLADGLEPHLAPLSSQKYECSFLYYIQLLMLARLVDGLKPHPPPLSSQKNEMLLFGLCSLLMISQAGRWTQTPFTTPLQPKKLNTHFWITFNFWWSAGLVNGLKPHPPPLSSQKNEMLIFELSSTSDDQPGW